MAEIERWITVKGNHIPILKGESEEQALNKFFAGVEFDDTDDIDIDIELEDADKGTKYDTIYYTTWGWQDHIVKPEDIDKVSANGYRIHEMDITAEMKDIMDKYLNSEYIEKNNLRGLMTDFDRELRQIDIKNGSRGLLKEHFRRIAIDKCAEAAKKTLDSLPKLQDTSIDNCVKGTNSNGYVESQSAKYGSVEREWYTSNCQRCIIAYEMRRRGYDVEANKYLGDRKDPIYNTNRSMTRAFLNYDSFTNTKEYEHKPNGEKYASRAQLIKAMEKDMLNEPEGARFVLSWKWKNCGYGHTLNAEKINGKIEIYDAQTDERYTIKDFIQNKEIKATTLEMTRVDNLILSNRLEDLVKWKK